MRLDRQKFGFWTDSSEATSPRRTTRLAPSPTGALHLGNARTFLLNWAMARTYGWRIVLRIEDLDGPRIKPEAIQGIQQTLGWLGLDWDGPVWIQSQRLTTGVYHQAMEILAAQGLTYASAITRAELEAAASAPHGSPAVAGESVFPASLRPPDATSPKAFVATDAAGAEGWRFVTPQGENGVVEVADHVAGLRRIDVAESIGDFVIWTKRSTPSYQLAVVVDDYLQEVTDVVRGDDLIDSAGRQVLLMRSLGITQMPAYWHLPLVVGTDGRRLAKRHGDTRIDHYRQAGVRPEAIWGLIAYWSHLTEKLATLSLDEFLRLMPSPQDFGTLVRGDGKPVVMQAEIDPWLMSQCR
jgi:glutamyl-tRNA synthetase